jgi:threonine synthase
MIARAFSSFGSPEVVTLTPLSVPASDGQAHHFHVAELWHGPTLAFKDLGLCLLLQLLDYCLQQRKQRCDGCVCVCVCVYFTAMSSFTWMF